MSRKFRLRTEIEELHQNKLVEICSGLIVHGSCKYSYALFLLSFLRLEMGKSRCLEVLRLYLVANVVCGFQNV